MPGVVLGKMMACVTRKCSMKDDSGQLLASHRYSTQNNSTGVLYIVPARIVQYIILFILYPWYIFLFLSFVFFSSILFMYVFVELLSRLCV